MVKKTTKYFSIFFSLIILYLSYLLIKPFIGYILSATILAYVFYPFYQRLNKRVKNKNICLLIMVLIIVMLVMIPFLILVNALLEDAVNVYNYVRTLDIEKVSILPEQKFSEQKFNVVNEYILNAMKDLPVVLINFISEHLVSMPEKLIGNFIMILIMLFLFREGPKIVKTIKIIIPLEDVRKDQLIHEFEVVIRGVVYSLIASSLIQGIIGGISFYIFGIPNPLLWGAVIAILSMIPIIGYAPVWVGAVIYLILKKYFIRAIILAIYAVAINNLDNLLIAKIIGKKTKINSILALIGVISGLRIFGLIGVIIGPLILSLFISTIKFYTAGFKKKLEV